MLDLCAADYVVALVMGGGIVTDVSGIHTVRDEIDFDAFIDFELPGEIADLKRRTMPMCGACSLIKVA